VQIPPTWRPKLYLSFAVSVVVFVAFSIIVMRTPWEAAVRQSDDWTVKRLGELFLTRYELLFELISLALLVAIIGAIITAASLGGGRNPEQGR